MLCVLCAVGGFACEVRAAEWTVHPGESIAAAIARAAPGDTVRVERGRYEENLVIGKPLTLRGLDRPTLSGGLRGHVIRVTAPDVTIENLIVIDSGADLNTQDAGIYIQKGADRATVRRCDLVYNLFGLYIEGVKDAQAIGNLIVGKRDLKSVHRGNGIQVYNTSGARIEDNNVGFVRDAIYVDVSHHAVFRGNRLHHSRYGTHYMNSNDNLWENNQTYRNRGGLALMEVRNQTVRGNRAWDNTDHGIMLRTIQDSVIENNTVENNARGFFIYDAEYNVLRGNRVIGNQVGVHLWAGSVRNLVERNDFIGNHEQIRYVAARDEIWGRDDGNYWSNYVGWDRDGDGIGDVPYEANDLVDRLSWRFPMMKLLLASPAVQTLRLVARQFPLLRAPSIVDPRPRMRPWQALQDESRVAPGH
jgi:nitrous oxidase accessory protein